MSTFTARFRGRAADVPGPTRVAGTAPPPLSWRTQLSVAKMVGLGLGLAAIVYGRLGPTLPGLAHAVTSTYRTTNHTSAAAPMSMVQAAQTLLGVFLFFVLALSTEALPGLVVGLCSPMLLVLLAKLPKPSNATDELPVAYNAFTSDTFFLILGAFVLVAVMMKTGLGKRIAFAIVASVRSTRADRIMGALMGAQAVLFAVLPTVADTALFLPISRCLGDITEGREKPAGSVRAHQGMILTIAGIVPLVGGMLFLTSGVPNLILQGTLAGQGIRVTWLDWLWWNLPLWGLLPIVFWLCRRHFGMGKVQLPDAATVLPRMRDELGPISRGEIWTLVCICVAFTLWITGSFTGISSGMAALIMAGLLFLPGTGLNVKDFAGSVMWEMLFLIGGAISLGNLLYKFGVVDWAANGLVTPIKHWGLTESIVVTFVLLIGLQIARAGILSGGAMAAVFVPLSLGLAHAFSYNALPFSIIVVDCLNVAIFVPISTVAVLIAVQAAKISWREIFLFGGLITVVADVYIVLVMTGWFALLGMPVQ